jgi:NADH dehydrogenase
VGSEGALLRPTYVSDVARSVAESLPGGCLCGGLFNIGGPEVISVREMIGLIAGALGRRLLAIPVPRTVLRGCLHLGPLVPSSLSESRLRLFGEDHYVAVEKASTAGFEAEVAPVEGIAETVDWYIRKRML